MPETPSNVPPEISADIDQRLSQIADAAAKGLGEEVRRELRGHLDELFLRYRRPTAHLSELDAMTLVEKNFGDPARVRKMLLRVRPAREMPIDRTFFRRICALVITASCIQALVIMFCVPVGEIYFQSRAAAVVWDLLMLLGGTVALWVIGVRCGLAGSSERPMPLWMRRSPLLVLAALSVGALILSGITAALIPLALDVFLGTSISDRMLHVGDSFLHWIDTAHFWVSFPYWAALPTEITILVCVFGLWPFIWMVWCEAAVGVYRIRPAAIGIAVFVACSAISELAAVFCLHLCGLLGWPQLWRQVLSLQRDPSVDFILACCVFAVFLCLAWMHRRPSRPLVA